MRAVAATVLVAAALLAGCSSDKVTSELSGVRSSAAAAISGTRATCSATKKDLETVRTLADRIAKNPALRTTLLPQLSVISKRLSTEAATTSQLRDVSDSTAELISAMKDANTATVTLAAKQAVLSVRATQAACAIVKCPAAGRAGPRRTRRARVSRARTGLARGGSPAAAGARDGGSARPGSSPRCSCSPARCWQPAAA